MPHDIKLEVYTVRIRQKHEAEYLPFHQTFAENKNMTGFVSGLIQFNDTLNVDEARQKSTQFITSSFTSSSEKGIFSGIIESGDYGTESTLVNLQTKKKVYQKKKDDIDIKPFYYLLWIPKVGDVAFIFLQRTGIFGINQVFTSVFRNYVDSKHNSIFVEFAPYVSKQLAKTYLSHGTLKEISLRRFNLPSDVVEHLGLKKFNEEILSVEIKIRSKKNGFFKDKMSSFLDDGNGRFFDLPALKSLGMDGEHEEKVRVEFGGNTRTIDLSDSLQIKPYFDIESEVDKNPQTGHPLFQSIDDIAKRYVKDLRKEIFNA